MKGAAAELLRLALMVLLSALSLQLYFFGRVALMTVVDPQSTTFQRSEAWRLLRRADPAGPPDLPRGAGGRRFATGAPSTAPRALAWSQQWVDYPLIAPALKRAVIASEDAGFEAHRGVEWDALRKAWERNRQAVGRADSLNQRLQRRAAPSTTVPVRPLDNRARIVEPHVVGGSTITQQLAKNLFLGSERNLARKGQEFVITLMLEALLTKARILEIYLNSVEWGEGVFGAEAAARHYFHEPASALQPAQAAQLAVMLPAPKRFEKRPGSAYVTGRAATVAARMGEVEVP